MEHTSNSTLFAWLGNADLASSQHRNRGIGPIADAISQLAPRRTCILSAQEDGATRTYTKWLTNLLPRADVRICQTDIRDPWDFNRIYTSSSKAIEEELAATGRDTPLTFHLSPGTAAMSASWMILSKNRFPARLIQSSERDPKTSDYPIRSVNLPFDLSIELISDLLGKPADSISRLGAGLPPENPEFSRIIHKSIGMRSVILRARRAALLRDFPIFLLGESGTGKELLARAIHAGSPRASMPFKAINCGAIPKELIDSRLFGHVKGAFTGATRDQSGIFEDANGGTVFLDELGELPLEGQVRLLRALQEYQITRVGDTTDRTINVRIIAATNRDIHAEVRNGSFRLDLYHRVAVAVIAIPPLRERSEDIDLLLDDTINQLRPKLTPVLLEKLPAFSPSARKRLREYDWPGNVRELQNTVARLMFWSVNDTISADDVERALPVVNQPDADVLHRPIVHGFKLRSLLDEVRDHYVERTLRMTNGGQTKAAELLGITRQTLANWSSGIR